MASRCAVGRKQGVDVKARPAAGGGEGASNVPESRTTREPVYGTRTVRARGTTLFDGEPLPRPRPGRLDEMLR